MSQKASLVFCETSSEQGDSRVRSLKNDEVSVAVLETEVVNKTETDKYGRYVILHPQLSICLVQCTCVH